ncbi:hypothetical protein EVAR_47974_1 [Eumeta japonica]|uniref:Uncharacterized protein n=1 Tax=Eumeta variegata TaxID=151549 RepID=A0A4C1XAU0_EUMVA|nr:hypothetical protein EVAR_47974_1 [Eumeta japonica]
MKWTSWLKHKNLSLDERYHTLTEYRREVAASAIAFHPEGKHAEIGLGLRQIFEKLRWDAPSARAGRGRADLLLYERCVRPLALLYSDASADGVEERSLVSRSRSHARLRRNATMSHAFSCVEPAFIDLQDVITSKNRFVAYAL